MKKRDGRNKRRLLGIAGLTILFLLVFLAFWRFQKLTGDWMRSVEEMQELQKSYEELLQENQEKIQELEKQLESCE